MGPDLIVYRSTAPEVIEAFNDAHKARSKWSKRVDSWARKQIPGKRRHGIVMSGINTERISGVEMLSHNEEPPEGWRVERSSKGTAGRFFTPRLSTKAGKAIAAQINEIGPAPDVRAAVPGMPRHAGFYASPGYELREGDTALYCLWSTEPDPEKVNADMWEGIPLSRYYAVKEAEEQQHGAVV